MGTSRVRKDCRTTVFICTWSERAFTAVKKIRLGHRRRRRAAIYTLIETARFNDIDPQAWLADVLARLPEHPAKRIGDLLPEFGARKKSLLKLLDRVGNSSSEVALPCGLRRARTTVYRKTYLQIRAQLQFVG
jgi:IS66 C-terminal element